MVKKRTSTESKSLARIDNNNNQPVRTVNQSAPSTQITSEKAEIIAEMEPLLKEIVDFGCSYSSADVMRQQNIILAVDNIRSGSLGEIANIKANLRALDCSEDPDDTVWDLFEKLSALEMRLRKRRRHKVFWYNKYGEQLLHAESIGIWARDESLLQRLLDRGLMTYKTVEGHRFIVPGSIFKDRLGELSWIVERDQFFFTDHDGIEPTPVFGLSCFGAKELIRADKEISAAIKASGDTVTAAQTDGAVGLNSNVNVTR